MDLDSIGVTPTLTHIKKPKPPKNRKPNKRLASENSNLGSVDQTPKSTQFEKPVVKTVRFEDIDAKHDVENSKAIYFLQNPTFEKLTENPTSYLVKAGF